jgi:hypothetical protein
VQFGGAFGGDCFELLDAGNLHASFP